MKAFTELKTIAQIFLRWVSCLIKLSWTICSLIIVGFAIAFVISIFTNTSWTDSITERYKVYRHNDVDRYYIYDVATKKKTVKWISSIDDGSLGTDSLVRFSRKNIWGNKERFGYIDARTGKIAIKPQFYYASEFSEGLAAVNGEMGVCFIDITGKVVIPIKGDVVGGRNANINNGTAIVKTCDNKCGIISVSGAWALEPKYYKIEHMEDGIYIVTTDNFEYGAWSASKGWIFEPIYNNIEYICWRERFEVARNGLRWETDKEGNTTKPLIYNYAEQLFYYPVGYDANGDSKGIATDYFKFFIEDNECGVFNIRTKEIIFPAIYQNITMEGKDIFELTLDFKNYLVYKDGTVVLIKTE